MKNIYSYCIRRRNGWGNGFGPRPTHCAQCDAPIAPQQETTGAAGYGSSDEQPVTAAQLPKGCDVPALKTGESLTRSRAICYPCCGLNDMREMRETGRACLYFDGKTVTNWPGSYKCAPHRVSKGAHNMARSRYDVWFTGPDGKTWHGVNIGDNQILRCRRLKS